MKKRKTPQPTRLRLAQAIESLNDPNLEPLVTRARLGWYSDFSSPLATPKVRLAKELKNAGHAALASAVIDGEFDDTKEESDAWYATQGRFLLEKQWRAGETVERRLNTDAVQLILTSLVRTFQASLYDDGDVSYVDSFEALVRFFAATIEDLERRTNGPIRQLALEALRDRFKER